MARGYRCEATSVEGFVQQLAVSYVARGYFFYVPGSVPVGKDPRAVDRKLIARYEVTASKSVRARRKLSGLANVQYLRHGRFFVLLATRGKHRFFEEEGAVVRDVRERPIRFAGYAISFRGGHAHVRIERLEFKLLKHHFLKLAVRRTAGELAGELARLPFEPYGPVRQQFLGLLRAVNRARKAAGLPAVPGGCFRFRRRVCRPFTAD